MNKSTDKIDGLPEFLHPLFWEHDLSEIDIFRHADFIMARIMERGTWQAMGWLRKTHDNDQIISFLERRGRRILPPRELNYWALIADLPDEKRQSRVNEVLKKNGVWNTRRV